MVSPLGLVSPLVLGAHAMASQVCDPNWCFSKYKMHKNPLEIFSFLKINFLSVSGLSYSM